MKARPALVLFGFLLISGCESGRLYPVQGPLASKPPVPVFTAKVGAGRIFIVLNDGEKCKGRLAIVQTLSVAGGTMTGQDSSNNGLASVWDAIYGQGYYVSHVLGSRAFARAEALGNRGTILSVEMYQPEGALFTGNAKGVAKDNNGNIYKLML